MPRRNGREKRRNMGAERTARTPPSVCLGSFSCSPANSAMFPPVALPPAPPPSVHAPPRGPERISRRPLPIERLWCESPHPSWDPRNLPELAPRLTPAISAHCATIHIIFGHTELFQSLLATISHQASGHEMPSANPSEAPQPFQARFEPGSHLLRLSPQVFP